MLLRLGKPTGERSEVGTDAARAAPNLSGAGTRTLGPG